MGRTLAAITWAALVLVCLACGSERMVVEREALILERRPE